MYDAIIVGARVAGSPTAMLLAQRGYRVLLVDKASFFVAPLILGSDALGAVSGAGPLTVPEAARLRDVETHRHGDDVEVTGYL